MLDQRELLNVVGRFAAPLVTDTHATTEDVVRIGAAFLLVAEEIFKGVGGNQLAAHQFYVAADRCASAS